MQTLRSIVAGVIVMFAALPASAETVRVFAAGSLKSAMTEIAAAYERSAPAQKIELVFGPSGLLRERIEKGEPAHVFASADMGHPQKLAAAAQTRGPAIVFARNKLCALVRPGLSVTTIDLLDVMLKPEIRLGTSTPKADPSGDYAFALFAKAETHRTGVRAALEKKALQLTGGPTSERPPAGRNPYAWVMTSDKADVFLTYCTNAVEARAEAPALVIAQIPDAINVGADYGIVTMKAAPASADAVAAFIRSTTGQTILAKYGFGAGD